MQKLNVLFFGQLSEKLNTRETSLMVDLPISVNEVVKLLGQRHGAVFNECLSAPHILAAVNQQMQTNKDISHSDINEIAFFPPVTGG